jgi:uncharacterized protein YbjT (DUF2867 family)
MRFVITGASGHVGSALAKAVLDAGHGAALITRDAGRVTALASLGARVHNGSHSDSAGLEETARGSDGLFWMTPPGYAIEDYPGFQRRLAAEGAALIRRSGVARVVNLSSFGAHLPDGTGPIAGLGAVEALLDDAATHITHLRPVVFYENYLSQAAAIRDAGCVYMPVSGQTRVPMMATRDVGALAASRLCDTRWTGRGVLGLHGPAELTFDEAAELIGQGVGRAVKHVAVPPERARAAMVQRGMSPGFASLLVELYGALESGHLLSAEPRTPENTGKTTLAEFALEVLRPMVENRG